MEHLPLNYGPLQLTKVMDGQELNLGKYTLRFIDTPMLHWPDSMFTYLKEQGILFCMDGFGQHFASSKRFDDEVDKGALFEEAAKYYANILMPFGQSYFAALEKLKGLDIKMLATAHGIIWRIRDSRDPYSYMTDGQSIRRSRGRCWFSTPCGGARRRWRWPSQRGSRQGECRSGSVRPAPRPAVSSCERSWMQERSCWGPRR